VYVSKEPPTNVIGICIKTSFPETKCEWPGYRASTGCVLEEAGGTHAETTRCRDEHSRMGQLRSTKEPPVIVSISPAVHHPLESAESCTRVSADLGSVFGVRYFLFTLGDRQRCRVSARARVNPLLNTTYMGTAGLWIIIWDMETSASYRGATYPRFCRFVQRPDVACVHKELSWTLSRTRYSLVSSFLADGCRHGRNQRQIAPYVGRTTPGRLSSHIHRDTKGGRHRPCPGLNLPSRFGQCLQGLFRDGICPLAQELTTYNYRSKSKKESPLHSHSMLRIVREPPRTTEVDETMTEASIQGVTEDSP
jgi:hypothetical protein